MSIDWSKAPKGATHYRASIKTFYKQDARAYEWDTVEWRMIANDLGEFRWSSDLIERPVTQWTGEGFPPVGTKCEMRLWPNGEWEPCQPAYYLEQPIDHSDQVVVYQNSLGGDVCYILDPTCAGSIEFRPIPTPEQIAAEERNEAQKDIKHIILTSFKIDPVTASSIAGVIADSHYRKVTP